MHNRTGEKFARATEWQQRERSMQCGFTVPPLDAPRSLCLHQMDFRISASSYFLYLTGLICDIFLILRSIEHFRKIIFFNQEDAHHSKGFIPFNLRKITTRLSKKKKNNLYRHSKCTHDFSSYVQHNDSTICSPT